MRSFEPRSTNFAFHVYSRLHEQLAISIYKLTIRYTLRSDPYERELDGKASYERAERDAMIQTRHSTKRNQGERKKIETEKLEKQRSETNTIPMRLIQLDVAFKKLEEL